MSKVPSYIRQKSREAMKTYNEYLYKKMDILENAFKESRDILKLTYEEVEKIKRFDIHTIDDLMYVNNKVNGDTELYAKIVAKVLVRFVRLNILIKDKVEKLFKDNIIENGRGHFAIDFSLEFKLILLNLIFKIQEQNTMYEYEYYDFGIQTNFILSKGKRNIILYGIRHKDIKVNHKIVFMISKMKEQENYKLFEIINKYKDLKIK